MADDDRKIKKGVVIQNIRWDIDGLPPLEAAHILVNRAEEAARAGFSNISLDIDTEYGESVYVNLIGDRPETDEERDRRILYEKEAKMSSEMRDRAIYERLKEKFG